MPFVARILLQAIESVPPETWRVASQFGLESRDLFRLIEWPALRSVLPGVAGLVFMLCFTSFAVVLTLGGGPKATTLEAVGRGSCRGRGCQYVYIWVVAVSL